MRCRSACNWNDAVDTKYHKPTFEHGRHVSMEAPVQVFWLWGQQGHLVGNSCTVPSSTTHTDLKQT